MAQPIIIDIGGIVEGLKNADPQKIVQTMRQVIFKGEAFIRNAAVEAIKSNIPYRSYPYKKHKTDPHAKYHGMLRGKQYGPLWYDVQRVVSSDATSGSVNIYSPHCSRQNRWNVLMWLNDGTDKRNTGGRMKITRNDKGQKRYKFTANGNIYRPTGAIAAKNFFIPAAMAGMTQAESYIATEIPNEIIKELKK